jgi:outer membrane protein
VFSSNDGDIAGLKVDSAFGTALQAGLDIPLDKSWGLFLDIRKIYVRTTANGSIPAFGGPAAKADVTLDPTIVHAGLSYRF